jgi:DNA polymerase-4
VRYDDFTTVTRSQSDPQPTRDPDAIATRAVALLDKTEAGRRPIRLLGVSLHNLEESDSQKARRAARDDEPRLPLD